MPKIILNLTPIEGEGKQHTFNIHITQEGILLTSKQAVDLLVNTAASITDFITQNSDNDKNNLQLGQPSTSTDQKEQSETLDNSTESNTINQGNNGQIQPRDAPGGSQEPPIS